MKITYLGALFLPVVLSAGFILRSFGANNEMVTLPVAADYEYAAIAETKEIKIGFVSRTYGDMFVETIMPSLKKMGYKITLVYYDDYIRPNFALSQNEIDLNIFQYYAYLNNFKFENDLALSAITEIPTADLKSESYVVVAARTRDLNKQFVRDVINIIHSDSFRNIILDPAGKYSGFQRPRCFYDAAFGT
ncbi:MAG: hypothetical protein LBQ87_10040 [Candidatus Fibromonas sp.]|jgi:D-methionine transport system substrate-binding protein|nr:hypothetical protein [Candidatus Fibromonas sp.]